VFLLETGNLTVKQADGFNTKVFSYLSDTPKASLVIFHGMAEHHERYDDFCRFLCGNGFDVYIYDHRGHGKDTKLEDLGFIAEKDGDKLLTGDAVNVVNTVRAQSRTKDFFVFGHSMGSFICRVVIQEICDINGAVICGTNYPDGATKAGGLCITALARKFKGAKKKAPGLNKFMFENKDYLSVSTRTVMDWLSRDNTVVGQYINDPYCGFVCTNSFYHDLIAVITQAAKKKAQLKTRKDFPMFFIAGAKDPVGGFGKQVDALVKFYNKNGYTAVKEKIYPECRHELLNELNKEEVYNDVLTWLYENI